MSSNSADDLPSAPPALSSQRRWSLTVWLALVSAVTAFAILAVAAFSLYFGLAQQLKNQNRQFLIDEVDVLQTMVRAEGNGPALAGEVLPDISAQDYIHHHIRLMDRDGRTLTESNNMGSLPPSVFPPPARDLKQCSDKPWQTPDGARYLGTSLWVTMGERGEPGILQVALDVTRVDAILAGYRRKLVIILLAGFVACIGTGLAVARRGTRPLREMAEQVHLVTASNLDLRISGTNWPEELTGLADALNGMLDRLQDSFARLYNSATNLAHKMRTPLTVLRGEAEVALSASRTVDELQDVISSSLEEYDRLARLSDNILFLANAEMGRLQPVMARIEAESEIATVCEYYEPLAEEKGISVTCRGTLTVTADPALFRKALASLLVNSLTYTPSGGAVTIDVSQGEDGTGEVSVTDTGCGIPEAELEKIFDRFYRIYATRYMDLYCTGLGLPIAKAIMALHNGGIEVRSQPGKGTTAILKFPPPS